MLPAVVGFLHIPFELLDCRIVNGMFKEVAMLEFVSDLLFDVAEACSVDEVGGCPLDGPVELCLL